MCRFAGECPSVDMGCGRAVICPLIPDDDNAYAHFTSAEEAIAHDKVCPKHPANIRAELLEHEADWLANRLACIQSESDIEPETRYRSSEWWRETARKAMEEGNE